MVGKKKYSNHSQFSYDRFRSFIKMYHRRGPFALNSTGRSENSVRLCRCVMIIFFLVIFLFLPAVWHSIVVHEDGLSSSLNSSSSENTSFKKSLADRQYDGRTTYEKHNKTSTDFIFADGWNKTKITTVRLLWFMISVRFGILHIRWRPTAATLRIYAFILQRFEDMYTSGRVLTGNRFRYGTKLHYERPRKRVTTIVKMIFIQHYLSRFFFFFRR